MSSNRTADEMNKLKHAAEEMMVELLHATTEELLVRIRQGEASPQDISNAIRICKENDVTIAIKEGSPLGVLDEDLPFEGDNVVSMVNK